MLHKANRATLRDKILHDLILGSTGRAPVDKANSGSILWTIYYWQIVNEIAQKECKGAWENASRNNMVAEDDQLRKLGAGEHLVADSNNFSALVSVTKPVMLFDRELFIERVAKKYKLDIARLLALAEDCKTAAKPRLSKRVVEAAS